MGLQILVVYYHVLITSSRAVQLTSGLIYHPLLAAWASGFKEACHTNKIRPVGTGHALVFPHK
jgi:hypothetical protein